MNKPGSRIKAVIVLTALSCAAQAASNTSDGRMQALAGAAAALNLYSNAKETGDAAKAIASATQPQQRASPSAWAPAKARACNPARATAHEAAQ